jgi:hypothetical protein
MFGRYWEYTKLRLEMDWKPKANGTNRPFSFVGELEARSEKKQSPRKRGLFF